VTAEPLVDRTVLRSPRRSTRGFRCYRAQQAQPGALLPNSNGALRRAVVPTATGRHVWAEEVATSKRRNLTYEEDEACWAFATIEVLRVPLLQIAPSKTDSERLLLASPELADVLSAIVRRLRRPNGAIPLVASYDVARRSGTRNRTAVELGSRPFPEHRANRVRHVQRRQKPPGGPARQ